MSEESFLSNEDLADRYHVPVATVRKWRHEGTGPPALKLGRHVRYRPEDVTEWERTRVDDRRAA